MNSKLPERPKKEELRPPGRTKQRRSGGLHSPAYRSGNRTETLAEKPAGAMQACKRLMKGAFRGQLEQAVKFENQVFAERVRSDEAKEAFRAFFEKHKPEYHP